MAQLFLDHWLELPLCAKNDLVSMFTAARADERVKARFDTIEEVLNKIIVVGPAIHRWMFYYDLVKSMKLPEAQPVEHSEGEGT